MEENILSLLRTLDLILNTGENNRKIIWGNPNLCSALKFPLVFYLLLNKAKYFIFRKYMKFYRRKFCTNTFDFFSRSELIPTTEYSSSDLRQE